MHPGLAIPVSVVDSHTQRLTQLIEPAEKDRLPRIPREQAEHEPATRAHDLHRNQHEGLEKGFEFHPQDGGLLGGVPRAPAARRGQPQR